MTKKLLTLSCMFSMLLLPHAQGAGFVPVYLDGASEGYNDTTVITSDITGLSSTLGADRKACLEAAMLVLEAHLNITVDIRVEAEFNSLGGTANSATLGSAGPNTAHDNFTNAPVGSTWFVQAEANQLAGSDLSAGSNDIGSQFNSDVDGGFVLGTLTWYYGIDGNTPANHIDFFSTAIHELCHGIGFLSLMTTSSGALFGGQMDIYTSFLRREGSTNLDYTAMSNAQRAAGNISVNELVWNGTNVETEHGSKPLMYAPNPVEGGSSVSHWDTTNTPNLVMEPFATGAFTDITIERELFDDIHWPLLAEFPPLDPDNVYTNFGVGSNGNGASAAPFDNLADAVTAANSGANIFIEPGTNSPETFTSSSALGVGPKALMLLNSTPASGTVSIGTAPARPESIKGKNSQGFVTRK